MHRSAIIPRLLAVLLAAAAVAAFFLPYIDISGEFGTYAEYMPYLEYFSDMRPFPSSDLTIQDMKSMSLYECAKLFFQAGETILSDHTRAMVYAAGFSMVGLFAVLALVCAILNRPLLLILDSLLMGTVVYLINWKAASRGIVTSGAVQWGIARFAYYPCAALLVLAGIWLLIEKGRARRRP